MDPRGRESGAELVSAPSPEASREGQIYFAGNYSDWAEASREATGFETRQILENVLAAVLKVKRGEVIAERDSVLLDKIPYNFPLIVALLSAAARSGNRLSVLDFGGSLGTSYFQSREFLSAILDMTWSIVEQAHFVAAGRTHLESGQLHFYETIADCVHNHQPNIVVLSGVLPYLQNPYQTLQTILQLGVPYIFVDRTQFIDSECDRLTIQHVPEQIYKASFPAWFFNETKFLSSMSNAAYKCLCDFPAIDSFTLPDAKVSFKGFIFRINSI